MTIVAPDPTGAGFFRRTRARQLTLPASHHRHLPTLVERRIEEIANFVQSGRIDFDIWHAHCSITANALSRLSELGRVEGFVRTVHHLDQFADPRLDEWQTSGVERAGQLFTVSRHCQATLRQRFGRSAAYIGNGVDCSRFTQERDEFDAALPASLGLTGRDRPVFLAVGGIEARKNTVGILHAFLRLHADHPNARLIVAGGASLLDHGGAQAEFATVLDRSGASNAVLLAGIIDDCEMPALYRVADALVFVSLQEGFGLCPLEAMACATPTIVSRIAPFTEHFRPDECLWAEPDDIASIETAMRQVLSPSIVRRFATSGPETAARFAWPEIASRHLDLYRVGSLSHA